MNTTQAAQKLLQGELIVFPTETVYGLGAVASNAEAVQKIFEVKGRPQHNPLILHIFDRSQLDELVELVPDTAKNLMDHFWPGPLTICLKKHKNVSDLVTAGLDTVCIRMPDHPIAQELLKKTGEAVAAPSANLSGKPSTTRFKDAVAQLQQDAVYFLDGGNTQIGLESTVIDCSDDRIRVLRPGSISRADIETTLDTKIFHEENTKITSPGQLLQHYSPEGKLTVIIGKPEQRREWIQNNVDLKHSHLGLVGSFDEFNPTKHQYLALTEEDFKSYAQQLYGFLNWCDRQSAQHIYLEFSDFSHPLTYTLLNRLKKASNGNIIRL